MYGTIYALKTIQPTNKMEGVKDMKFEYMNDGTQYPVEIEIKTMENWLKTGAIKEIERGDENIYFKNDWGMIFFCKCL